MVRGVHAASPLANPALQTICDSSQLRTMKRHEGRASEELWANKKAGILCRLGFK
jgi:hypothetical protein